MKMNEIEEKILFKPLYERIGEKYVLVYKHGSYGKDVPEYLIRELNRLYTKIRLIEQFSALQAELENPESIDNKELIRATLAKIKKQLLKMK